jgi:hypothetical protein
VVIKEGERLPGFNSFEPQADAAEFCRHGVHIYPIETAADHVAQGVLIVQRRWFALSLRLGTRLSQMLCQAVRHADKEVSGAHGRSHTLRAKIAFSASATVLPLIAFSTTGSSAESSRHCTSESGV